MVVFVQNYTITQKKSLELQNKQRKFEFSPVYCYFFWVFRVYFCEILYFHFYILRIFFQVYLYIYCRNLLENEIQKCEIY